MNKMKLVVSLVLVLGFCSGVWGQSVGVALQEGIYKEGEAGYCWDYEYRGGDGDVSIGNVYGDDG